MDPFSRQIGGKVQELRHLKGWTLEQLASETGFTKSYLSKVENSRKIPPIGSLARICSALGSDMATLFQPSEAAEVLRDDVCVVRAAERQFVVRGGSTFGYDYENLATLASHTHMHPFLFTFPRNVAKDVFFEHPGEEFVFVVSGRLRFVIGAREWVLEPGDSLHFNSDLPHRGEALGSEAKAVVVIHSADQETKSSIPAHVGARSTHPVDWLTTNASVRR